MFNSRRIDSFDIHRYKDQTHHILPTSGVRWQWRGVIISRLSWYNLTPSLPMSRYHQLTQRIFFSVDWRTQEGIPVPNRDQLYKSSGDQIDQLQTHSGGRWFAAGNDSAYQVRSNDGIDFTYLSSLILIKWEIKWLNWLIHINRQLKTCWYVSVWKK